jgi:hypothetical protein
MATRYCIQQVDTGLYYLDGAFHEEPEWFSHAEAAHILRTSPLAKRDPSAWAIKGYEFHPEDTDMLFGEAL